MSKYSKQYCEKYDPGFPWDFNLDTEFDRLEAGEMSGVLCEGYGFIAIGKDAGGQKFCVFQNKEDKFVNVPLSDMDDNTYLRVRNSI